GAVHVALGGELVGHGEQVGADRVDDLPAGPVLLPAGRAGARHGVERPVHDGVVVHVVGGLEEAPTGAGRGVRVGFAREGLGVGDRLGDRLAHLLGDLGGGTLGGVVAVSDHLVVQAGPLEGRLGAARG